MTEGKLVYHVETVKGLLGMVGNENDNLLQLYVDMTIQAVLNHCNISSLPSALDYTVCQIASDAYRRDKALNALGRIGGGVSRIEEDGRSVEFDGASRDAMESSIRKYLMGIPQLDRFKKVYRTHGGADEGL